MSVFAIFFAQKFAFSFATFAILCEKCAFLVFHREKSCFSYVSENLEASGFARKRKIARIRIYFTNCLQFFFGIFLTFKRSVKF